MTSRENSLEHLPLGTPVGKDRPSPQEAYVVEFAYATLSPRDWGRAARSHGGGAAGHGRARRGRALLGVSGRGPRIPEASTRATVKWHLAAGTMPRPRFRGANGLDSEER